MTCASPPELADKDLLTFIDDEAEDWVTVHLKECPHCRKRAEHLGRWQGRLTAQLYRLTCPSPEVLGEYHLSLSRPALTATITEHLAECPHCTREIAQLRDYLADLAPALEPDVFAQLRERVRVLVGRLVSGGPAGSLAPALAGLRGEEEGPLVYQADEIQVIVQVFEDNEHPDRRTILGLVTGLDDPQKIEAHLWQGGQRLSSIAVDKLGNFVISNLVPASYDLILNDPEIEIHIQDLQVGTS